MSYNGAPFCGWQIQPGVPTVQGAMEDALGTLLHCRTAVTGAGRTDTGVHALRYTAHFDFDGSVDCQQLRYRLNAILPKAVSILGISPAEPDFHARFSAVQRSYSYFLHRVKNPFLDDRSYWYGYPGIDFELMNSCARLLLGRHDFSCFEKSGGDNKTSVCTVSQAVWVRYDSPLEPGEGSCWRFDISADRFLRNMVRAVVGTLLEVGRGRRSQEDFASLILPEGTGRGASRRSEAGESVPGHALFLTDVKY